MIFILWRGSHKYYEEILESRKMTSLALDDEYRVILHFDVDAMYVACERELNSELIAVPVGVSQ
jgi:hypothetical protein